jgi:hypothetical protein
MQTFEEWWDSLRITTGYEQKYFAQKGWLACAANRGADTDLCERIETRCVMSNIGFGMSINWQCKCGYKTRWFLAILWHSIFGRGRDCKI